MKNYMQSLVEKFNRIRSCFQAVVLDEEFGFDSVITTDNQGGQLMQVSVRWRAIAHTPENYMEDLDYLDVVPVEKFVRNFFTSYSSTHGNRFWETMVFHLGEELLSRFPEIRRITVSVVIPQDALYPQRTAYVSLKRF